ncbi:MAG: L,D-transpeptidase family protein [Gammaproteobacteria bacterium]|nr:L,D-transpeptidase family protein [Gammaproteobacteria bacterium]MDH5214411.1 L,D-transpeptidase family protein [Gammaproteobacteria bacterium]MDH5499856.1 L,D-transpeptidase family protein [Gammaproteobacteria bacterium]
MSRFPKVLVLLSTALLAGGCAVFSDYGNYRQEPGVVLPPLVERPREDPISRNYFVLESAQQSVVGEPQIVFSRESDTFPDFAREYGLGYDELIAANPGIDPWLPGENTPILLPTQYVIPDVPRQGIVLNIASKRLFYFPKVKEGEPVQVMTYPIGIGRVGWETPLGEAKVISKATDPTWYVPLSVRQEHEEAGDPLPSVVPPGPDNPLGRHVLKLDMPGYLLHGTNQPYGVGMRVSHGCVRLYPENIELLYSLVAIGEKVRIINEPYLAGWNNGELYFESHRPLEDDAVSPQQHLQTIFDSFRDQSGAFAEQKEQDEARAIASGALGVPIKVLRGDSQEVFARARIVRNTVTIDPDAPTLAEVRELLDEADDELDTPPKVSGD